MAEPMMTMAWRVCCRKGCVVPIELTVPSELPHERDMAVCVICHNDGGDIITPEPRRTPLLPQAPRRPWQS